MSKPLFPLRKGDTRSESSLRVAAGIASTADRLKLKRFGEQILLQQPENEVYGYSIPGPLRFLSQQIHSDGSTLVAGKSGSHLVGFADFRPEMPDYRWHCVAIGDATGTHDPVPVLSELINVGVREGGIQGVKRLYAKVPTDSELVAAFRASGFVSFAQEVVFVAESPRILTRGSALRRQGRSDTWSIHQLYNASVPTEVLQAEAYTSHRWDLPKNGKSGSARIQGWMVGDCTEPEVYLRSQSVDAQHILDIVHRTGESDLVGEALDAALLQIQRQRAARRVFVPVRTYTLEMQNALLARGFRPWLDQTLMMKYTAVPLRAATHEAVLAENERVERLPRRVPAYLTIEHRHTRTNESD